MHFFYSENKIFFTACAKKYLKDYIIKTGPYRSLVLKSLVLRFISVVLESHCSENEFSVLTLMAFNFFFMLMFFYRHETEDMVFA